MLRIFIGLMHCMHADASRAAALTVEVHARVWMVTGETRGDEGQPASPDSDVTEEDTASCGLLMTWTRGPGLSTVPRLSRPLSEVRRGLPEIMSCPGEQTSPRSDAWKSGKAVLLIVMLVLPMLCDVKFQNFFNWVSPGRDWRAGVLGVPLVLQLRHSWTVS